MNGTLNQQRGARAALPIAPKNMLLLQGATLVIMALVGLFFGLYISASIAWGGLAVAVPNALFAWAFFSRYRSRSGMSIMIVFYVGEAIKLIVTASLAVMFFNILHLNLIALLVGAAGVSLSLMFAPLLPKQWMRKAV